MRNAICVFCGASDGVAERYVDSARHLGRTLARQGRTLIYGGGGKGLMGALANAALEAGGEVHGVIPQRLVDAETAHHGLTSLEIVPDMHTRKARMAARADGFIALPGGIGTLEELFEIWTWSQIGCHSKPVGLLDVAGYYQRLCDFLRYSADEGFIRAPYLATLLRDDSAGRLLDAFDAYRPHNLSRWD
ncbi:Nucleotide monophosphate nucleosidase PpnN/YdgH,Lonely Guy (LOG) family [Edwardsiella anguillarum]|uniref:LOG family protein n=1 Tax=Edwardsiella TaxID=635 RepID=UPI00045D2D44|nr:TIGR00730 family Rossman fold protein [Edwardsiella anguillarum]AKM48023.1 lysine decarboxylase [Edwardsiella sp. EA181011]GAJ68402.1 lysine decarboxylase family protein [Edwardsiella piscicida]RFT03836.1 Rossman fold protein, TIGR00730 family [Edwardsiella anguillarum]WHP81708.1 TIGR00730 family Rossman fold protein [Edwardsiella anguillarum]WHQ19210.1 TIGR00730 family Rossman fold protein [Edwardsiella anguillarum]